MATQVGTGFGLAINTVVMNKVLEREVEKRGEEFDLNATSYPPEAYHLSLNAAFYACAAFAFVGAVVAVVGLVGIGKVGHREKKAKMGEDVEGGEKGV
ncbi:hypothetical protein JCM10207_000791 [Rhodosporidiobolus poonsookiae]